MFQNRLKAYRNKLNLKKREMATKIDISESYYNLIENGKREPSKKFLYKLVLLSNKPEEYWLYGVEKRKDIVNIREDFKCSKSAFEYWNSINELDKEVINNLFKKIKTSDPKEKTFLKGLKADLLHLYEKSKN